MPPYSFAMPADLGAIAGVTNAINATLDRHAVPAHVGSAFGLALDELLTNAIAYGGPAIAAHGILIDVTVGGDAVSIRIRDRGQPFDPLAAPDPDLVADLEERAVGGLGIHFVRTLMSDVSYRREDGWNVVDLVNRFGG